MRSVGVDPHFGALFFSPFMQVIWPGGTIPGDHVASLERLTGNQVSALRSYQNSTPIKGIWKAADCRGRGPPAESKMPSA